MGLISPGGENLRDFLEGRQVLLTYDGDFWNPLCWPQEKPVAMRVGGGHSEFLFRLCRGLRSCVDLESEPEIYSQGLTWILGYLWSLPRGVSLRL